MNFPLNLQSKQIVIIGIIGNILPYMALWGGGKRHVSDNVQILEGSKCRRIMLLLLKIMVYSETYTV